MELPTYDDPDKNMMASWSCQNVHIQTFGYFIFTKLIYKNPLPLLSSPSSFQRHIKFIAKHVEAFDGSEIQVTFPQVRLQVTMIQINE